MGKNGSGGDHWWDDEQVLAYAVLEQARLLCEQLLVDGGNSAGMRRAHRGLGLGAYVVSEDLDPRLRVAVLELCREHGPVRTPPANEPAEAMLLLALHAEVLIARARRPDDVSASIAARQAGEAVRTLTALVGSDRAAALRDDAIDRGYLQRRWQRGHLAPLPENLVPMDGAGRDGS
jgi:GNAT superfamily N-acetyltransferase